MSEKRTNSSLKSENEKILGEFGLFVYFDVLNNLYDIQLFQSEKFVIFI